MPVCCNAWISHINYCYINNWKCALIKQDLRPYHTKKLLLDKINGLKFKVRILNAGGYISVLFFYHDTCIGVTTHKFEPQVTLQQVGGDFCMLRIILKNKNWFNHLIAYAASVLIRVGCNNIISCVVSNSLPAAVIMTTQVVDFFFFF